MGGKELFADVSLKKMSQVHRMVLKASGGKLLRSAFGMPVVELHTVGRKSGHPRTTMLTSPAIDDNTIVLVASKGGDDRDPEWFKNALANPEVTITLRGSKSRYVGRRASDEEKTELWPKVTAAYKGYSSYQKKTDRNIPLLICERQGPVT